MTSETVTVTMTNCHGTYTIEAQALTVTEVMERHIIPLLLAAGFQQGSINRFFCESCEETRDILYTNQ